MAANGQDHGPGRHGLDAFAPAGAILLRVHHRHQGDDPSQVLSATAVYRLSAGLYCVVHGAYDERARGYRSEPEDLHTQLSRAAVDEWLESYLGFQLAWEDWAEPGAR